MTAAKGNDEELLLDVAGLSAYFRTYEGNVQALDEVSFQINKGDALGLVGESGCGKTVTGLSIMRLIRSPGIISGGKIIFKGQDLLEKREEDMRKVRGKSISMIFQEPMTSLNPVYSVGTQVRDVIMLHQGIGKSEAGEKALHMLELVRIANPAGNYKKYPHELSGGMRQRVMIAMALSSRPDLLIADEPTTALDVVTQAEILNLIRDLIKEVNTSLLLITHDLGVVAQVCNKVGVMYAGRVVEFGDISGIFQNPKHPYTRGLMKAIPSPALTKATKLEAIPGSVPNLMSPPSGCKFNPRCSHTTEICATKEPALVEVDGGKVACFLYSPTVRRD